MENNKTNKKKVAIQRMVKQNNLQGMSRQEVGFVLDSFSNKLSDALLNGITPKMLSSIMINEIDKNPKLMECDATTLFGAMQNAISLGFEPKSDLGLCYFIPYGKNIQFQIGYKGWRELAYRSGEIEDIQARCVYKGDVFEMSDEFFGKPKFKRTFKSKDDKDIEFVIAAAKFKSGSEKYLVMSIEDVEKLRLRSPMQKGNPSGAWKTDYAKMCEAKATKQLCKELPLSIFKNRSEIIVAGDADEKVTKKDFETGEVEEIDFETLEDNVNKETGEIKEQSEEQANLLQQINKDAKNV